MPRLQRLVLISVAAIMLVIPALACSPTSNTITETITEAELNEEMADQGLMADLQPGVIVFTGTIEGADVVMKMTLAAVDGGLQAQVTEASVGGLSVPTDLFNEVNTELADSIFDDDEYQVDSVTISDTEITIEATKR